MKRIFKSHHPRRHVKSFKYAFEGVFHALINEPNFRVQIVLVFFVVGMGFYFGITPTEWGLIVIALGMLLSAELINTAIEVFIDVLIKEYDDGAKVIKDVAAGFVLIYSITTLILLGIVFIKYFIQSPIY